MAVLTSKRTPATIWGGVVQSVAFTPRRNAGTVARVRYTDKPGTPAQEKQRAIYRKADRLWIDAPQSEREKWRPKKWRRAQSNYALYMSYNLQRVARGEEPTLTPPDGH